MLCGDMVFLIQCIYKIMSFGAEGFKVKHEFVLIASGEIMNEFRKILYSAMGC